MPASIYPHFNLNVARKLQQIEKQPTYIYLSVFLVSIPKAEAMHMSHQHLPFTVSLS